MRGAYLARQCIQNLDNHAYARTRSCTEEDVDRFYKDPHLFMNIRTAHYNFIIGNLNESLEKNMVKNNVRTYVIILY